MSDATNRRGEDRKGTADSWWLEIGLSVVLAAPWVFAAVDWIWRGALWVASVALYWFLVLAMFGRGSAITSFLVVLILATLISLMGLAR